MKSFISKVRYYINRYRMITLAILILSGVLVAGAVSASTTISTDITTGGQLSVTGTSTLATTTFSGNVGIGTTTPITALSIVGTTTTMGFINAMSSSSATILYVNPLTGTVSIGSKIAPSLGGLNISIGGLEIPNGGINLGGLNRHNHAIDSGSNSCCGSLFITDDGQTGFIGVTGGGPSQSQKLGFEVSNASGQVNEAMMIDTNSNVGIGTTSPVSSLQVVASTTNATTTVTIGQSNQNKGSCLVLYDAGGNAVYASVASGATTFTLSTTSCK
jgi:hypothetical protein